MCVCIQITTGSHRKDMTIQSFEVCVPMGVQRRRGLRRKVVNPNRGTLSCNSKVCVSTPNGTEACTERAGE